MRPVASEAEARVWGELCGRGFAHRGGDPARFYRKLCADPTAKLEWIRVAVSEAGVMVGSVRLFDRQLDVGGAAVPMAGLGEVCTDPDYRGRGISTMLLVDAVQMCETRSGAAVSLLHAAAAVAPLYRRFGYEPLSVPYGRLCVPLAAAAATEDTASAPATTSTHVDVAAEWAALAPLHDGLTVELRAVGTTRRDEAYWRRWIAYTSAGRARCVRDEGGAPRTYAVLLRKPEGYKICDMGCIVTGDGAARTALADLTAIIADAVAADIAAGTVSREEALPAGSTSVRVLVPALLLQWLTAPPDAGAGAGDGGELTMSPPLEWAGGRVTAICDGSEADVGWMLRPLHGGGAVAAAGDAAGGGGAAAALQAASDAGRFLVWPLDAF